MTRNEYERTLEQAWLGIASCSTCGICRQVAERMLEIIGREHEARRAAVPPDIDACLELDRIAEQARCEH